ncbi:MAG: retropepsin-like aspartic protease [Planctomycetota bacterium]
MALRPIVVVLALVACSSPPPVRVEPYVDELLQAARAAIGFDALQSHPGGFELIGDRGDARNTTSFRFSFDVAGRSILDLAGDRPSAEGCDGIRCWSQDPSGLVRELDFGEAERVRCEAWLRTGLWLDPWVPRFTSRIERGASTVGRTAIALARPDTPFRARVWIDTETFLPLEYELSGDARRVRLEDWTRVAGARLPRRFVHVLPEGNEVVEQVTLATPTDYPSFGPPRSHARDTEFAPAAAPDLDAALGLDGRLYVRALLDGARPVTLLVDSGFGASAIEPALADELGWSRVGAAALSGVGGRSASGWRRSNSITLGPMSVTGLEFVELPGTHAAEAAGFAVDGVLGADVLSRAVFELDPELGRLRAFDSSRWERPELDWRAVRFDNATPCVEAQFGTAAPLWLRIDTGSSDSLSVAPWAVTQLKLAPSVTDLESVFLVGPFGSVRGWRGELALVELAGVRFERLAATFLDSTGRGGPLDNPWVAGNVGLPALRSTRLYLDLPRRKLALASSH